ncbi:SDR family NAD(P)-dependent oxidoreductase [Desmospora profundinema]|uniref:3-oxoacyl-[acyl-carrier protein] reductase n=1 Tax=Desmospora profundinema TaxID=1571184 RepID=A0ABU1IRA1_9BACL|nr:SDR family oxidoreductase [Desmospora profundinema]MDR6227327.1 3-oxoacyl-[acyl-carrier protein] reductase [Desmospora profundinema]
MEPIFSKHALQGKRVIVTGATGGIGRAIARVLREMGADLLLTGRRKDALEEVAAELAEEGKGQLAVYRADLVDALDRERLVTEARTRFGGTDILINNAGTFASALMEEVTEEELDRVMRVNVYSVMFLTQLVYREMKERRAGKIIQLSSLSGIRGWEGGTIYAASKFALNGFTQSLAVEAARHGIQVNAVAPGFVDTDMGIQAIGTKAKRSGRSLEEGWEAVEKSLPSGRLSTPEEVAACVAFLSTGAADNIIGSNLRISGGGLLG